MFGFSGWEASCERMHTGSQARCFPPTAGARFHPAKLNRLSYTHRATPARRSLMLGQTAIRLLAGKPSSPQTARCRPRPLMAVQMADQEARREQYLLRIEVDRFQFG